MDKLAELKNKATRIKDQIVGVVDIYHDLQQKAFVTEEILRDLKQNLETTQRKIFSLLKAFDKDEKLAYQSDLTVAEVRLAKSLLTKKAGLGSGHAGKALKSLLATDPSHRLGTNGVYFETKVKPSAQKD
jgi:polyhydroxyalkanoate synthesis regulator phasin